MHNFNDLNNLNNYIRPERTNRPPSWTAPILSLIVPLLSSVTYLVPTYTDLDPGAILSWNCTMNAPLV